MLNEDPNNKQENTESTETEVTESTIQEQPTENDQIKTLQKQIEELKTLLNEKTNTQPAELDDRKLQAIRQVEIAEPTITPTEDPIDAIYKHYKNRINIEKNPVGSDVEIAIYSLKELGIPTEGVYDFFQNYVHDKK